MKSDIVGLVYTGDRMEELRDLVRIRSVAALPLLGRYRLIDFILSNMIHAGIRNIGLIMQSNYHSLIDHIGSGREWNLHGKRSGLSLLPPYITHGKGGVYEGTLDALQSNMSFLRRSTERYILVTDSFFLYSARFEDMCERHIATGADITLLYTKDRTVRRNGRGRYLDIDGEGRVERIEFDPIIPHYPNTYMSAFIIRRELLISLVDRAVAEGMHHFIRELLVHMLQDKQHKVFGYECPGEIWRLDSVQAYYKANMDFLDPVIRKHVFSHERPIWTKLRDEMPARYMNGAKATNSLIADGCVIEGKVENCILFRGVKVRPGAVVRGSIVMQDALISRDAQVENCILDKQTTVREGMRLVGSPDYPVVIPKNLTI
jgi:glucose-1-phosphate adenylyltransferase